MSPGPGVFTDFVRSLDPAGTPPDVAAFDRVWEALRGTLVGELRRRGLWHLPPHFLGIHGSPRWVGGGEPGDGAQTMDALDELCADAYSFVFVDRIANLRAHALVKPNIEGLVFLALRQMLHELQRRHDPLGARIFTLLRKVAQRLLEAGELEVVGGGARLGSATVLAFAGQLSNPQVVGEARLAGWVERWGDDLLPDLVTARGKGCTALEARVGEHIRHLESQGVACFTFGALVRLLKRDVRRRWAAILDQAEGEKAVETLEDGNSSRVALTLPDPTFEQRHGFRQLLDCVEREMATRAEEGREGPELEALWEVLRQRVLALEDPVEDGEEADASSATEETPAEPTAEPTMPSRREVSRLLGIPRDRLPRLYEILGTIVDRCQGIPGGAGGVSMPVSPGAGGRMETQGPRNSRRDELRKHLRQATGQALARSREGSGVTEAASPEPRPGDVFVLRLPIEAPLEWLILEADPEDGTRCRVMPADTHPLAGTDDFRIDAQESGGPLILRCRHVISLPWQLFQPELRSRRLEATAVDAARQKARPFTGSEGDGAEGSLLGDSEWRAELARGIELAIVAGRGIGSAEQAPGPDEQGRRPPRRSSRTLARKLRLARGSAAVLALVSLGLSAVVWLQHGHLDRQALPTLAPPSEELVVLDENSRGPGILHPLRGSGVLLLDVVLAERPDCELLRLELLDEDGGRLWTSEDFELPTLDEVRVALPERFLTRHPSHLSLQGRCDGNWREIERRALRIDWR